MPEKDITIFQTENIRRVYKDDTWYFSVVDIVRVLLDYDDHDSVRKYWKVLKGRLNTEGSQLVTNCYQLRLMVVDGKRYLTDTLNTEQLFRLIQSIPSPKVEHLKL